MPAWRSRNTVVTSLDGAANCWQARIAAAFRQASSTLAPIVACSHLCPTMCTTSIVSMDWHTSAEGETILQHFYNPQTTGRKICGVLERPSLPSIIEEVSYKLFVAGKAGVGKSATVARLAGTKFPNSYLETSGIRKSNVYWPVKIWDKIILFKLQFWDAGDGSTKKYSHVLPACKEKADAIVFIFSFADSSSFMDLPQLMSKMTQQVENPASIVIGTRYSPANRLEVQAAEIKEFELKWKVPVLKLDNKWSGDRSEVHEVAPCLNIICEWLWIRDQEYLVKQGLVR